MEHFIEANVVLRGGPFDGKTQFVRFARDKPLIAMVTIDAEMEEPPADLNSRPPITRHVYGLAPSAGGAVDALAEHRADLPGGAPQRPLTFDYRGPMAPGAGRLN